MVAGHFNKEIIPITVPSRKEPIVVDKDEFPTFGTTFEGLQKLRPIFLKVRPILHLQAAIFERTIITWNIILCLDRWYSYRW